MNTYHLRSFKYRYDIYSINFLIYLIRYSNNSNPPSNHNFSFSYKIVIILFEEWKKQGTKICQTSESSPKNISYIKFVARSLLISGQENQASRFSSSVPKYVPLGSLVSILRGTCYIPCWQSLWRRRTSQSVYEAPRQTASLSLGPAIRLGVARSMERRPLPLPLLFSPGGYCVSSSLSRGFESLADISDGVQSLPGLFCCRGCWGLKGRGGREGGGGELEEFFGKGSWILRGLEGERFNVFDKRGGISFWRGNWP